MNKEQREKLSELDIQLWQMLNDLRTLRDDRQIFLDNTPHDEEWENTSEVVEELNLAIFCLASANEHITDAESIADSMPKEGEIK